MITWYIDNKLSQYVQASSYFAELTDKEHVRLYDEFRNACLQGIDGKILDLIMSTSKVDGNPNNSLLFYVLGLCSDKPSGHIGIKSEGSYPD